MTLDMVGELGNRQPLGIAIVPQEFCAATIRAPAFANNSDVVDPTLPDPEWRCERPRSDVQAPHRLAPNDETPRPVALTRQNEPPRWTGFPVTTPGWQAPCSSINAIIQAMI